MDAGSHGTSFLYMPVEVAVRELDSRLLIARFAVDLGLEVVLGQRWLMNENIPRMPPGVMLFKTMTIRDAKVMRQARACGYAVAAIDEEIPGIAAQNSNLRWTSEAAIDACDIVFALGDAHREALARRFPTHQSKFLPVGN